MIYRLSGDYNPLHIDPGIAKLYGFPMPIAHGLCTLGLALHNILSVFKNNHDFIPSLSFSHVCAHDSQNIFFVL